MTLKLKQKTGALKKNWRKRNCGKGTGEDEFSFWVLMGWWKRLPKELGQEMNKIREGEYVWRDEG